MGSGEPTACARPRAANPHLESTRPARSSRTLDRRRAVGLSSANINRPLPPQTPRAPRAPRARQTPPFGASPSRAARGRLCPRVSSRARLDATREGRGPEARVERASSVGRGPRFSARMSALDEAAAGAWAGSRGHGLGALDARLRAGCRPGRRAPRRSLRGARGGVPPPTPELRCATTVGTGVRLASRGARPFPAFERSSSSLSPSTRAAGLRLTPSPSPPPKHYSPPEGRSFAHLIRTEGVVGAYRGLGPPGKSMMMSMNSMNSRRVCAPR